MSVYLLRPYGNYPASSTVPVTFPDDTESTLIAQGLAIAAQSTSIESVVGAPDQVVTQGGNKYFAQQGGYSTPAFYQGPLRLPVIALGSAALTGYETAGVAQTSGTFNLVEIFVPYRQTWTGAGWLNGTTVGTNNAIVALYGTDGVLIANSAVAGTLTAGASTMQNAAFTAPVNLVPGRYFLGLQMNGATDTVRHLLSANGAVACTGTVAGAFGTVPASITAPTTFTTAVGPIMQLYV